MLHLNENDSQNLAPEADEPVTIVTTQNAEDESEAAIELDIIIYNVVCAFSVRCHLKLHEIALKGLNVEYRRETGMLTMRLRRPYTTATIWSSGRITITGATSEEKAKIAARRYARCLSKLGFPVRFQNFRIVNVLGTCSMPWPIRIINFSQSYRNEASYEPELHPGVTYNMREPKATLKIFSTGSVTVTAPNINDVELAIQNIFPLVQQFRNHPSAVMPTELDVKKSALTSVYVNQIMLPAADGSSLPKPIFQRVERGVPSTEPDWTDNIAANARRRATDCWVSKVQKNRPRYNDPAGLSVDRLTHVSMPQKMSQGTEPDAIEPVNLQLPELYTTVKTKQKTKRIFKLPADFKPEDVLVKIDDDVIDW